jgi:ATP-dependent helicase/nuclease subunit A
MPADTQPQSPVISLDEARAKKLAGVIDWKYPFESATERAAKTSVTALRRQAMEEDEEAEQRFEARIKFSKALRQRASGQLSAEDAGVAHHKFLEYFSFEKAEGLEGFSKEAKRLEAEGYLTAEETAALDLEALADFWGSDTGKKIRANAAFIRRELPFTARFGPDELDNDFEKNTAVDLKDEFVVVQGVADLVALMPREIWLVDFKTDKANAKELREKIEFYSLQLRLYARALEKIYSRPVTNCWLHFLAARKTERISP